MKKSVQMLVATTLMAASSLLAVASAANFNPNDLVGKWLDTKSYDQCVGQITYDGSYHLTALVPTLMCPATGDRNTAIKFDDTGAVAMSLLNSELPALFLGHMAEDKKTINWDGGGIWVRQ